MPTRYTPILRINKHGVIKSPDLPARASMTAARLALAEAMDVCIDLGWNIDYEDVAVVDGPEHVIEPPQDVNSLIDAEGN